jgi:predicted acyltransferase
MLNYVNNQRLTSLDFFRGFSILSMILINFIGNNSYTQLKHATWHGFTFADTIFPFFLWIIGVSIVFSFTKKLNKGFNKKEILYLVLKRSLILFAFGIFLNLFPYFNFSSFRIMGILQRIALTYLFAGIIFLYFKQKWQIIINISLLIIYILILFYVPVPCYGSGVLDQEGNIVQYVDKIILKNKMYNENFDPEGILSTLSAITTVLFGILAGNLLISKKLNKINLMFLNSFGLIVLGLIMNLFLPINKNLWTSSFSVFMSGLAFLIFSISYWFIEIKNYKKWSLPFVITGMNSIILYVISILFATLINLIKINNENVNFIFYQFILNFISVKNAHLSLAFFYVLIIYLIAYIMYKEKCFLKI